MTDRTITLTLSPDDADLLQDALAEVDWDHHDYYLNDEYRQQSQEVVRRVSSEIGEALETVDGGAWMAARVAESKRRWEELLARHAPEGSAPTTQPVPRVP